jgi:predicted nucleotidyltransferase
MLNALFRSKLRTKALAWLLSHPDERYFIRQLESILGEDATNLSRELARLEALGILTSRTEGRQKYYQANTDSAIFPELKAIVLKTIGLADVLREVLAQLSEHIDVALVYGSSATGDLTADSDVDVLVVGEVDEMDLHRAATEAEKRLSRPINYTLMRRSEFKRRSRQKTGFLSRILAGKKIQIIGNPDEV